MIFISRQLASIDRLLFANLKCSRRATAAHRKERSLQDDEKAREAITEGETLIAGARPGALTINARGADPENVARCDIFHVLRTREHGATSPSHNKHDQPARSLEVDDNTGGIR